MALGDLEPSDVEVQLLHGPVAEGGQLSEPRVVPMQDAGPIDAQHRRYVATFSPVLAGRYGYTARVVPHHPDLGSPVELGLIAWA